MCQYEHHTQEHQKHFNTRYIKSVPCKQQNPDEINEWDYILFLCIRKLKIIKMLTFPIWWKTIPIQKSSKYCCQYKLLSYKNYARSILHLAQTKNLLNLKKIGEFTLPNFKL